MFESLNRQNQPKAAHAMQVKSWVREVFRLTEDPTVLVTELRCKKPGCPPVETIIAILPVAGQPGQHKISKSLESVVFDDIALLTTQSARTCDCPNCDDSW